MFSLCTLKMSVRVLKVFCTCSSTSSRVHYNYFQWSTLIKNNNFMMTIVEKQLALKSYFHTKAVIFVLVIQ